MHRSIAQSKIITTFALESILISISSISIMSKKMNETKVYKVDSLSTSDYKVASSACTNIARKVANKFFGTALSISQFANWLASENDSNANFIKEAILKLAIADFSDSGKVFKALKAVYPYKDKDGKLISLKTYTKGIKTFEYVTTFTESFLNTILSAYLRDAKPFTAESQFFSIDKKGTQTAISEESANKTKAENDSSKEQARENAKTAISANERKLAELAELAKEFNSCTKLAEYSAIRDKFNEILNS